MTTPLTPETLIDANGNISPARLGEIERIAYAGYASYSEAGAMLRECIGAINHLKRETPASP